MVRAPTPSVLLDRVEASCVPRSSRTNEWMAHSLTPCHEGLLKFDFRHGSADPAAATSLSFFSSSLIFSILTSRFRDRGNKPPLTGGACGSLSWAPIPVSGSSFLLSNPGQSYFSFTRESALIPSRNPEPAFHFVCSRKQSQSKCGHPNG